MQNKEFENLKVGDKVRIVAKRVGEHWNPEGKMDKWLGKVMTVRKLLACGRFSMEEDKNEFDRNGWRWYPHMIAEKVNPQEIHITVDGNKTIAVLKECGKVVKRAEAKCNPEDKFDFETGAKLAFDRLIGNGITFHFDGKTFAEAIAKFHPIPPLTIKFPKAVKEVKRAAKVGEYIKIVNPKCTDDMYKAGDILKVYKTKKLFGCAVFCEMEKKLPKNTHWTCDKGNIVILEEEYVVLENYEPSKEKKPEFKPYLERTSGGHLGVIGEPTKYKDAVNRPLCIGDTVEVFDECGKRISESVIVKDGECVFVTGYRCDCDGKNIKGYKIIKKRSFDEVKDGSIVDGYVKYIKTEKE